MLILKRVVNGLAFYVGWILAIGFAAVGSPLKAALASYVLVALHLALNRHQRKELVMVASLTAMGGVLDTLYMCFGVVRFESPNYFLPQICPLWIMGLYALFGTSIDHSLFWLRGRPFVAAVLGAGGGILSYVGGVAAGAAELPLPHYLSLVVIGVVWFFFTPFIYRYSQWLDRHWFGGEKPPG